jgi:hypothetical protein
MSNPKLTPASSPEVETRRPYQAPRVVEDAEFESLSLACAGKVVNSGDFRCTVQVAVS